MAYLDRNHSLVYVRSYSPKTGASMTHGRLGTDRDPGPWPLSRQEQERRISVFWMVYRGEMWEVHYHHIPLPVNDLTSA
jgi:hypothetical protein